MQVVGVDLGALHQSKHIFLLHNDLVGTAQNGNQRVHKDNLGQESCKNEENPQQILWRVTFVAVSLKFTKTNVVLGKQAV